MDTKLIGDKSPENHSSARVRSGGTRQGTGAGELWFLKMVTAEDAWEEDAALFLVAASQETASSSPVMLAATEALLEKYSVESIADRVEGGVLEGGEDEVVSCTAVRVLEALHEKNLGGERMLAFVRFGLSHVHQAVRRVAVNQASSILLKATSSGDGGDVNELIKLVAGLAVLDPSTMVAETASKSLRHVAEANPWLIADLVDVLIHVGERARDATKRSRQRSLLSWLGSQGGFEDVYDLVALANSSVFRDLEDFNDPLAQLAALELLAEEAREGRGVVPAAVYMANGNGAAFERVARSVSRLAGPGESDLVGCRACWTAGAILGQALNTEKSVGMISSAEAFTSGCVALADALADVVDPSTTENISEERMVAGLSGVAEAGASWGGSEAILSAAATRNAVPVSSASAIASPTVASMRVAASRLLRGIQVAASADARPELRSSALFGLACLAGARRLQTSGVDLLPALLSQGAEMALQDLCYSISPARLAGNHAPGLAAPNLFGALLRLVQVPFLEERVVAWATLGALLQRSWALREASVVPGLFSFMCNHAVEAQSEGREARFRCICLVARAISHAKLCGDELNIPPLDAANVLEFAKSGPYGITPGTMMHEAAVPVVASRSAAGGP